MILLGPDACYLRIDHFEDPVHILFLLDVMKLLTGILAADGEN